MRTPGLGNADGSIEAAERAFAEWRQNARRGRIPDRLWELAAELVRREGLPVTRVSKRLRLDFRALKQRIAPAEPMQRRHVREARVETSAARFAELRFAAEGTTRPGSGQELVRIRVEGLRGVAMEIISPVSASSEVVRVVGSLLR